MFVASACVMEREIGWWRVRSKGNRTLFHCDDGEVLSADLRLRERGKGMHRERDREREIERELGRGSEI